MTKFLPRLSKKHTQKPLSRSKLPTERRGSLIKLKIHEVLYQEKFISQSLKHYTKYRWSKKKTKKISWEKDFLLKT